MSEKMKNKASSFLAECSYLFLYAPSGGNGGSQERQWEELQISGGYAGQQEVTTVRLGSNYRNAIALNL